MSKVEVLPKAYLGNRLYVPAEYVTRWHKKQYTYLFGPANSDNPEDFVETRTYREFSSDYIGFARGNLQKIKEVFGDHFRVIDQRILNPHGYDLQFTGELLAEQMRCWAEWCDYQYGVVEAPPRWGKTIFMCWMICRLKQKSLVLAQEDQLLDQFEEEMRLFTNVTELERKHGKKLIGRPRNSKEFFPIATLSTWQSYDHNLSTLRENRDEFGAVFVDEAHSAAAPCFARVINTTNSYYRIAVTATPKRKDGTHVVMFDVVGPVVTKGITEQLPVHVKVVKTGVSFPPSNLQGNMFWNQLLNRTARHERRNELVCRRVMSDVRQGHSVLVVTDRIEHIYALSILLKKMAGDHLEKFGGKRIGIAELHGPLGAKARAKIVNRFTSKEDKAAGKWFQIHQMNRKQLRLDTKAGKIKIVIAYSKIVQLGWNVPAWSSLHSLMPMSNKPNWYQRISRIRTKCANCPGVNSPDCLKKGLCTKKQPVCHIYVDHSKVAQGCFATQHELHVDLGFIEQVEHEDLSVKVTRDPNRKGRTIRWDELG